MLQLNCAFLHNTSLNQQWQCMAKNYYISKTLHINLTKTLQYRYLFLTLKHFSKIFFPSKAWSKRHLECEFFKVYKELINSLCYYSYVKMCKIFKDLKAIMAWHLNDCVAKKYMVLRCVYLTFNFNGVSVQRSQLNHSFQRISSRSSTTRTCSTGPL